MNEFYIESHYSLLTEAQRLKNKEDNEALNLPPEEWVKYKTKQLRSYGFDV